MSRLYQRVSSEFAQLVFGVQAVTFKPAHRDDNLPLPLVEVNFGVQEDAEG